MLENCMLTDEDVNKKKNEEKNDWTENNAVWIIGCTEWYLAVLCAPESLKSLISNTSVEKKQRWLGGSMYWPDEVQNRNSQWCGSAKWLRLRIPHMGSRGLHVQVQDQAVSNCFPPLLVIVWRARTKRGWKCGLVGFSYVCVSYIKELVAVEKCAGKIL